MEKISQLKQKLSHGDQMKIAKATNLPYDTVVKVLRNDRNGDTLTGKKIVRAAKIIIENQERLTRAVTKSR